MEQGKSKLNNQSYFFFVNVHAPTEEETNVKF